MSPGDDDAVERPAPPSLHEAAVNVGARAIGLAHTRLELAGVELAEARVRLVQSLLLVGAALVFALLALMAASLGVIAWFWDTYRFTAIIVITLLHAAAAGALWYLFSALVRSAPPVFEATLAALRADAAQLHGNASDAPP